MSNMSIDEHVHVLREMLKRAVSFDNITVYADMADPGEPHTSANCASSSDPPAAATDKAPVADTVDKDGQHQTNAPSVLARPSVPTKKLCIVMVGLPARGKTHIARCLQRYLNWLGFTASVFNVGHYRRTLLGGNQDAHFFDPHNHDGVRARMELALECLNDMIRWFGRGGLVGIYDATNTTKERRLMVKQRVEQAGVRVLFLESICTDQTIVDKNITQTKLHSPDYRNSDPEEAVQDFSKRIQMYESNNETLDDDENASYIQIINVGRKLVLNDIQGFVQGKIVSFLLNTHIMPRNIYLSRHGESEWNVTGQLGGDPTLTARGRAYARSLAQFMQREALETGCSLAQVWTSQLRRTIETAEMIPAMNMRWRALNEIDAGVCEGMTYEEVEARFPEVAKRRKMDKLRYRYPGGESYVDVIHRLEPVILEIERQRGPVLIIGHNAVIRAIFAYMSGKSQEECPMLDIPLHTVFKLTTLAYGATEERFGMDVDSTCNNTTPEDGNSE